MKIKKKKLVLGITISLLLVTIAIVISLSSTNALFSNRDTSTRRNNYNTGILSVTAVSKTDTISLNNTLPMTDEEGEKQKPYIFTIKNNGNVDYQFDVQILSTDNGNIFDSQYIKIKVDNDETVTLNELEDSKVKTNLTLPAGEAIDISLRIWLDNDTPNTQIGKSFTSELVINGLAVSSTTNYGASASSYIINLYNNAEKKEVENNNIKYNYATSVNLMNDRLGGITKDLNAGNIRYYGANPNNYIDIGHKNLTTKVVGNWEVAELTKTITTEEECLVWVKNKNITNEYVSQYNYQTVSEFCSVKEITNEPILYRIIGVFDNMIKIVAVDSLGNYSKDSEWSQSDIMNLLNESIYNDLSDNVKNKIATVTWYQNIVDTNEIYPNTSYQKERENAWVGKVGLIYPSDYGYAVDFNNCNSTMDKYHDEECNSNNWLNVDLTISSNNSNGEIYPVFYLNSEVSIATGDGTIEHPYVIR